MAILSNINDLFRVDSAGAVYFATSAGANLQVLQSVGTGGSPIWVDVDDIIGGPYLPIAGGVLEGATSTDTGINFTVGGNLFVTGTSTLTGALSGTTGSFSGLVSGITPTAAANFTTKNYVDNLSPPGGPYLPLTGGTMANTNLVTNMNADLIDGYSSASLWRSDGGVWNPSSNITLGQSANGQEWSFDITRNGYTGGYWQVWDSSNSTMLKVDAVTGKVHAPYNFVGALEGNATTATTLQTARTIAGVSFNGSANISLNNNAITNGAGYTTNTGNGTVTSVATGSGLTGGTITTTGTLSVDSTVLRTTASQTITGANYFNANRNTTSSSPPLQVYGTNSGAIMAFHRGGYFAVNFGLDSDNVMRIGGWSAAQNLWQLDMNGHNTVSGSSRAPIFYDSNDTSYFLNPSTSGGNALKTIGDWRQTSDAWSGEVGGKMQYHGTNWYIQAGASFIYRNAGGSNQFYVDNTGTGAITNYLTGNNSLRSPIFYDSNNTGYYLDPASTSVLNGLTVQGYTLFGAGLSTGSWYGDLGSYGYTRETGLTMTGGSEFVVLSKNGQGSTLVDGAYLAYESANGFFGSSTSSYGNLTGIQATAANTLTVKQLDGGAAILSVTQDVRAPIFYDSANTAYYTRPASSSYINTLQTAGQIQVGASGSSFLYLGGTSGNYFRFHTNNADTYLDMNCGNIYWRQGASTRFYFYTTTANMTINGSLTQNSDIRVKENIVEISDCISKIQAIRGVYYNRTDFNTDITKIGVIAQEVEEVLPELILEAPDTGLKSVAYAELTAVLINAVKEQQVIIDDLKSRIEILEL